MRDVPKIKLAARLSPRRKPRGIARAAPWQFCCEGAPAGAIVCAPRIPRPLGRGILGGTIIFPFFGIMLLGNAVIFASAPIVFADTISDLQIQLNTLLAQVSALQAQFKTTSGVTTASLSDIPPTFRFSRTLQFGSRGADVRYLQIVLNRDPDTQATATGAETEYFGALTKAAVILFQNKYRTEVLLPAGLRAGTGIVGPLTRKKLNSLLGTIPAALTLPSVVIPVTEIQPAPEPVPPPPPVNFEVINQATRPAVVNILCTSLTGGSFQPLSGTGVVIDPRGIILTNAHVAQYMLLQDYSVPNFLTCMARTGSPATPAYTLKLLYISRPWADTNYKNITAENPLSTGENDFALLQITGMTNPDLTLPRSVSYLPIDTNEDDVKTGNPVVLVSYPAGFLGGVSIQRDLYPVSTVINLGKVYTFHDSTIDVVSLGGSPVAQHGSSGGAVVNSQSKLQGLIVTSTAATQTSERDLKALTLAHIDRSLFADTNFTLETLITSDLAAFTTKFQASLPYLISLYINELDSKYR